MGALVLVSYSTEPSLSPKKRPTSVCSIIVFSSRVAGSGGGAVANARSSAGSETSLERTRNISTSSRHSSAFIACASALRISRVCSASDTGITGAEDELWGGATATLVDLEDTRGGTCARGANSICIGEDESEGAKEAGADEGTGDVGATLPTHPGVDDDWWGGGFTSLSRAESESLSDTAAGEWQSSSPGTMIGMGGTGSCSLFAAVPVSRGMTFREADCERRRALGVSRSSEPRSDEAAEEGPGVGYRGGIGRFASGLRLLDDLL